MQVRGPAGPGDWPGAEAGGHARLVAFRVPTRVLVAKFGTAALLALAGLLLGDGASLGIALAGSIAVAAYAARDVAARERLRADAAGVSVVRGYAGRRRLGWNEIDRLRVDSRARLGARTELLEVDAGEVLYLFSRFDLGVDPDEALAAIETVRGSASS